MVIWKMLCINATYFLYNFYFQIKDKNLMVFVIFKAGIYNNIAFSKSSDFIDILLIGIIYFNQEFHILAHSYFHICRHFSKMGQKG